MTEVNSGNPASPNRKLNHCPHLNRVIAERPPEDSIQSTWPPHAKWSAGSLKEEPYEPVH